MIYEEDNTIKTTAEEENETSNNNSECEEKIEKLNKKLQATANELEEISALYARSVKDGLDKAKKIKELEDKIADLEDQLKKCQEKGKKAEELENQLKDCKKDREELENQLKECQDKRKELEEQLKACQEEKKKLEDKIKELEQQLKECQEKGKETEELEKKLKECQKEREELEKKLKECQKEREELENRLKECQDKNKTLDGKQSQWIVGEYKWMAPGTTMPDGWVKVKLDKGLTLVEGEEKGQTKGSVGKHTHKFSNNFAVWASKENNIVFINDRSGGAIGRKYMPFVSNFNNMTQFKEVGNSGTGITENTLAAGIYAELWLYVGTKTLENPDEKSNEKVDEKDQEKTDIN